MKQKKKADICITTRINAKTNKIMKKVEEEICRNKIQVYSLSRSAEGLTCAAFNKKN